MAKFLPDISRQQGDQIFVQDIRNIMVPTAAAFGILNACNAGEAGNALTYGRQRKALQCIQ